jgi:EmrB/QacA subfamily drug resistance transporter
MSIITTGRRGTLALAGLIVAVSMTTIDQTIVALSGPTIETDLAITHDAMQWAVNVYLIATAAFFLLGGRLADVFGHKRMALIGIAAFGATSLLCSLAPTGDLAGAWLIGARALQGVAGALMFPAAIGLVVQGFSREGRARAMATFFGITGAMTAIGPIAGGILSQWTWRSIFWINIPLAVVSFVIVAIAATPTGRRRERIDLPGAAVIAAGLGLVVFGLQQAGAWGWRSGWVIASIVAGVAFIGLFVLVERRVAQPLVRLQVFGERGFSLSVLAMLFASVAFVSTFFFLSVYGQVSLELSALNTGLLFLKFFIGFVIAAQIGSRRFDRIGPRSVYALGGLIGAAGFAWLAWAVTRIPAEPATFLNPQTWPIVLAGAGIGFMFSAASTDAVNRAIGASYGEVTAISQTMRNFGGALGLAVFTTVVTNALTGTLTDAFTALGAPAGTVDSVVAQISGAAGKAGSSLAQLPPAVQERFVGAVQQGYADSVSWAFVGCALAMAVVAAIGVLYPKGQVSAAFTDAGVDPEAATVAA